MKTTVLERSISDRALKLLEQFPVLVIIGSRQSGKTTLSKKLKPNWGYFDLENPRDYDRISHDPLLFLEQNANHIIIDEIQLFPELFKVLRGIIDADRETKGRFILTGSSSFELLKQTSETLAGRVATIELSPFKTNEFHQYPLNNFYVLFENTLKKSTFDFSLLKTNLTLNDFRTLWLYGGYPEPTLKKDFKFWTEWMQQFRASYLNRDIAQCFPKLNKINYRRFLRLLAKLSGTIVNKSDLARSLEISQPTIQEYLTIAEGTFLWRNIPSFESNRLKSVIKMPKGIIRDTGLLHYLLKISDEETLFSDPNVGLSFEGFVIEEIIRGLEAKGITNFDYYFYRTRNGAEIDLILEGTFGLIPIEIKYSSFTPMKQLRTMKEFIKKYDLKLGIVINQSNEIVQLTPEIVQIPVNYI